MHFFKKWLQRDNLYLMSGGIGIKMGTLQGVYLTKAEGTGCMAGK